MFRIDPASVVLFAAGSVVIALILCVALRRHKRGDQAIGWLMASNVAMLVASLGLLAISYLGFVLGSATVIGGAYAGISFALFAVLRAEGQVLPWRVIGGVGLAGTGMQAWLAAETGSVPLLMLTSSVLNSSLCLVAIRRVWQLTRGYGDRMAVLLCLPFAAIFTGYAMRLWVVAIWPEGQAPITATILIIVAMSWAAVILELGMIALRETQARVRLNAALEEVKQAHAARTKFLLGLSHEVRTPLNAILGMSELMRAELAGPLPDGYKEQVAQIQENGQDLLLLLSELIDAAGDDAPDASAKQAGDAIDTAVRQKFERLAANG